MAVGARAGGVRLTPGEGAGLTAAAAGARFGGGAVPASAAAVAAAAAAGRGYMQLCTTPIGQPCIVNQ
jgi:ABC-type phosphate transport system substrate-binding protein